MANPNGDLIMLELVQSLELIHHTRTYVENPNLRQNKYVQAEIGIFMFCLKQVNRIHLVHAEYVLYNKCGFPCKFVYTHKRLRSSTAHPVTHKMRYPPSTLLMSLQFNSQLVFDQDSFNQQAMDSVIPSLIPLATL